MIKYEKKVLFKKTPCPDVIGYSNTPRREMLKFVPDGTGRLLDVGCHTGSFGKRLKQDRKIEIWGVEPDEEASIQASQFLDKVIAEPISIETDLPDNYFDVIVFNDVLEHMIDPWGILQYVKKKLTVHGLVVASIPNIRNFNNLLHILKDGDFNYEPSGIRDQGHLRFFTRKSAENAFRRAGYKIKHIEGINEEWWSSSILRRFVFKLFPSQLEDTKYVQFAFVATPN